jgi:hypothetical protein
LKIVLEQAQLEFLERNISKLADSLKNTDLKRHALYSRLAKQIEKADKLLDLNVAEIEVIKILCEQSIGQLEQQTIPHYKKIGETAKVYLQRAELRLEEIKRMKALIEMKENK